MVRRLVGQTWPMFCQRVDYSSGADHANHRSTPPAPIFCALKHSVQG